MKHAADTFPSGPRDDGKRGAPVSLHIERLVLYGIPLRPGQNAQLQRALQHELARILETRLPQLPGGGGAEPERPAPALTMNPAWRPATLGRQIARSVAHALTESK